MRRLGKARALLALSKKDDPSIVKTLQKNGWKVELVSQFGGTRGTDIWLYRIQPIND
jgi:hypothetical protein